MDVIDAKVCISQTAWIQVNTVWVVHSLLFELFDDNSDC